MNSVWMVGCGWLSVGGWLMNDDHWWGVRGHWWGDCQDPGPGGENHTADWWFSTTSFKIFTDTQQNNDWMEKCLSND